MKLTTLKINTEELIGIWEDFGIVPITSINSHFTTDWRTDLLQLLVENQLEQLQHWYDAGGKAKLTELTADAVEPQQAQFAPLYR